MTVIEFRKVSKSYPFYLHLSFGFKYFLLNLGKVTKEFKRRFEVLRDVSFSVEKGECIGIIGRNGAGKSTLLSLIAGVIKPDSGEIIVRGRVTALLELGAGFHPDLTGRENIVLNGVLMGMTRREVLSKMDEIIEFSELGEFIDQPLRTYSSGMIARLGFSVTAHLTSDIYLIDEILAVGDIGFQKKCLQRFEKLRESGATIVIVSHQTDMIRKLTDRVIWIDNHTIRAIGAPEEICAQYEKEMNMA
ncbi:MAG: ABC transporter ATP-binding protein [Thermofilum sp.]